jgi:hypothetical protein
LYGAAVLTEHQYESICAILSKEGPPLSNNGSPYSPAHRQHATQAISNRRDDGPHHYPWLPAAVPASPARLPLSPAMSKRSEYSTTSSGATVTEKFGTGGRTAPRLEGTCEPESKRQPTTRSEAVKGELKPDVSRAVDALLAETSRVADHHAPLLTGLTDPIPKPVSNNINLVNQHTNCVSYLYMC